MLRRVTVVLDKPTRDGDTEIHLVTNLPVEDARAEVVAELYRRRWTIETAFQEMEKTLNGEINALGYPKAALFSFCVALLSYNVMSTVKAALRAAHGARQVGEGLGVLPGGRDQDESPGDDAGDPEGRVGGLPGDVAAGIGRAFGRAGRRTVPLSEYAKSPRGPKKPKPKKQSGAKIKHVATSKISKCSKNMN